jgi:2-polyprenyl-3-methyl-5-hydroxy-6-metoxy-1,4-benzoquinol methylase
MTPQQPRDERNPGAIDYFHRRIDDFDSIYNADRRRGLRAWLDRTLRASVHERFRLAFNLLGDMAGRSVLDIGCGTGRYMFESVRRGAIDVIGLDAAAGAVEAASRMARDLGMEKRVEFHQTDFMDYEPGRKFNVIFAIGYFDYILTPQAHIAKMLEHCDQFLYVSFPKIWHPMTPIRKVRLTLNNCPVRFYSKERIKRLLAEAGCFEYDLREVSRDFILIIKR